MLGVVCLVLFVFFFFIIMTKLSSTSEKEHIFTQRHVLLTPVALLVNSPLVNSFKMYYVDTTAISVDL